MIQVPLCIFVCAINNECRHFGDFVRSPSNSVLTRSTANTWRHHLLDSHGVAAHFNSAVTASAQSIVLIIPSASIRHQSQVIRLIVIIFVLLVCIDVLLLFFVLRVQAFVGHLPQFDIGKFFKIASPLSASQTKSQRIGSKTQKNMERKTST